MKEFIKRLTNTGTLISVVSLIGLILMQFGVKVDIDWLDTTIKLICALGIALGVLNNPTTPGIDNPTKEKEYGRN